MVIAREENDRRDEVSFPRIEVIVVVDWMDSYGSRKIRHNTRGCCWPASAIFKIRQYKIRRFLRSTALAVTQIERWF